MENIIIEDVVQETEEKYFYESLDINSMIEIQNTINTKGYI